MAKVTYATLAEAVRFRRDELGLTQAALAERMATLGDWNVRQSDVSRLERGKVLLPHHTRMVYLAAALDLSMGELLASSGWAGADFAFKAPDPPVQSRRNEALQDEGPTPTLSVGVDEEWVEPAPAPLLTNELNRLRVLMDDSDRLFQRTQEIMAHSQALMNGRWTTPRAVSDKR